jgi:hypothetical protein
MARPARSKSRRVARGTSPATPGDAVPMPLFRPAPSQAKVATRVTEPSTFVSLFCSIPAGVNSVLCSETS